MSIYQSTKVSPYVYQLTHKVNGQFYIGYREANLVPSDQDLGFFYWTSSKIVEPIFSEFNIQILAEFFDGDSAWYQEQRIIEANIKNPLCLNGHYVKDGKKKFSTSGIKMSEETCKKISIKLTGKKLKPHSEETKKKISDIKKGKHFDNKHFLGCKHSDESRLKMSISQIGNKNCVGRKISEETRLKISNALKGKEKSIETRAKSSISKLGKKQSIVNCP